MDIRPILSTLRRHKTAAALIVLEISLTCAILCNALDLIGHRLERINGSSGWAEDELVVLSVVGTGVTENPDALTRVDLDALRALPHVRAVSITNQMPYGNSSWNTGIQLTLEQERATMEASQYLASEGFFETIGVPISAGRDFQAGDYTNESSEEDTSTRALPVVVNKVMAERLFPQGDALGKTVYQRTQPLRIIGIANTLPHKRLEAQGGAIVFPLRMSYSRGGRYLLRVDPAQRAQVLKAAVAELQRLNPNRVVLDQKLMADMRDRFYAPDRSMAWLLVLVCAALLVVTALGIVGLASFWVQQRTRMIGVRRALGASRRQILQYFLTENFLLTTIGIAIGMLGAYGINQLLMTHYELARLPWAYLPVGAATLWLLGLVAVLGPALRAAALPPAVVMRSA